MANLLDHTLEIVRQGQCVVMGMGVTPERFREHLAEKSRRILSLYMTNYPPMQTPTKGTGQ